MRQKRFSILSLIITALAAVLLTLLLSAGTVCLLLGRAGLGVAEAMALIHMQFVGETDLQKAADGALGTLVKSLGDRWSYYVDAEGYQKLTESQNNAYVGIGVTVDYSGDEGVTIRSVVKGGPADSAGLKAGDVILTVNDEDMEEEERNVRLVGEDRYRVPELVRGPEGSLLELLIRTAEGEERWLNLIRGRVEEDPVSYELLSGNTGLVTIRNFNRRCAEAAIAAVDELVAQGAERLVFDVRNDGGGYLDELTRLLDHLLPEGTIFRADDRMGRKSSVTSDKNCVDLPMAVLVNGNTYSAAELFAAQLREMNWAVVVGTKTFGKGFSQQTFPLVSGGAINLSTAKYYTGNGVSLIGTGVTLDKEVALTDEQEAALAAGDLPRTDDAQLQAAIELLQK
ncbi:MAG: S41 family peptidase [Clostridia bacterium]|nr:S41 family peptidase [Clostridia bacterium]